MNEEELLDQIFEVRKNKWKDKYPISYCGHCQTYIITCPDCKNSSCNGSGCNNCTKDSTEFSSMKTSEREYLSPEEQKVWYKIRSLKKFINIMLQEGRTEMNWREIGVKVASEYERNLFDELKPFKEESSRYWNNKFEWDVIEDNFLLLADQAALAGDTDKALDIIYEKMDELMRLGRQHVINKIMSLVDPVETDLNICLAILSSSLPVAEITSGRKDLIEMIKGELVKKGENPDEVLRGIT